MKKTILIVALVASFAVAGTNVISPKVSAAMPEDSCENLALKKDMVVQKMADIEMSFSGNFQDVCTGEWHTNATRYSNDYNYPSFQRWVFPSGTITGTIDQGYLGGMQLQYTICTDGRVWLYQMAGGGMGYGGGNYSVFCNTIF